MRNPLHIVFFGDSICVGQGVAIHHGWVTRLSRELAALGEDLGRSIVVVNASTNGDTTRLALERMPFAVQSVGAEIMVVQFGLNDCNYWLTDKGLPRVSEEAFAANLKEIATRGTNFGARRIYVNTNHPCLRNADSIDHGKITYQENSTKYNAIVREVVAKLPDNVTLIDIEAEFERLTSTGQHSLERLLLPDGVHLSRSGHDAYFAVAREPLAQGVREVCWPSGDGA